MSSETDIFPYPLLKGIPINPVNIVRVNSSITGRITDLLLTVTPPNGGISANGKIVFDFPDFFI
jgi:hypothetical protein